MKAPRRRVFLLLVLSLLGVSSALDGQEKVPEASSPRALKPGQTGLLKTAKDTRYFLRIPRSYRPKKGARLIVFLHGSNMNGLQYLRSFEARKWCADDILACPNGEKGDDPYGANNFTFGSAPYVAEVTKEVQAAFKTTRTYIGGHSQGGFVTYSVIMHYPDLYHGAFPMAGDCWSQNEPNLWESKPKIMKKQKKIAIAVIHGREDPVVSFSQGQHAYDIFVAMGYPRVRLLAPENLGHQFMLSPVDEALEWLNAMSGADPVKSIRLAAGWKEEGEWGWVSQAAHAILSAKKTPRQLQRLARAALKAAESAAKKQLKGMAEMMSKEKPEKWLPAWYEFRRNFGETQAARKLVQRYESLRAKQRQTGARLFREASGYFRSDRKDDGRKVLREILAKAPASYEAYYAVTWLAADE